ncbi:hypothetical protein CMI42_05140 [Candidatus Pacearchaeota archaeon]|nr:hypothetical protein [Candidatus Pacearchaeota archaeon]
MDRWFEDKLDKSNLRKHTMRRINENSALNYVNNIFRRLSITNWLIIVNILVYIAIIILITSNFGETKVLSIFALKANSLFSGSYWTLLTSMFSHIHPGHILVNMISLFFIGNLLEKIIGRKKFLWFYLLSGLFAGVFASILSFYLGNTELGARIFISPNVYSLGASGAIFGVAGLLTILTPYMRVYLIAGPILAFIIPSIISSIYPNFPGLALLNIIITFYFFFAVFSMFSMNPSMRKLAIPVGMPFWLLPIVAILPLVVIGLFTPLPIGNTAHLGGLIAGIFYGSYLKRKYKRKTQMISKYFR